MNYEDQIREYIETQLCTKYGLSDFKMAYHIYRIKCILAKTRRPYQYVLSEAGIENSTVMGIKLSLISGTENSIMDILSYWKEHALSEARYIELAAHTKKEAAKAIKKASSYIKPDDIYLIVLKNNLHGWLNKREELPLAKIYSESDIERLIIQNISIIEPGLHIIGRQYVIQNGVIDILCRDKSGTLCIIEVKKNGRDERIVFQCLYYPMEIKRIFNTDKVRMIIVSENLTKPILAVINTLPGIEIYTFTNRNNTAAVENLKKVSESI